MSYLFQTVSIDQILTAAIYNQTELNARDHLHGVSGVSDPTGFNKAVSLLDATTAALQLVNSVTETDMFSFSVPANTLGTGRRLRLTLVGRYRNESGASRTITGRVKFGGTTMVTDAFAPGSSAGFGTWSWIVEVVPTTAILMAIGAWVHIEGVREDSTPEAPAIPRPRQSGAAAPRTRPSILL